MGSHDFEAVSSRVLGAAVEVHRALGPSFKEVVYERALCIELELRGIPFEQQRFVPAHYKGQKVSDHRIDLVVDGCFVVELKAAQDISKDNIAQAVSYLAALDQPSGLILNFGRALLSSKRVVN